MAESADVGGATVLLAEDVPEIRRALRSVLKARGYRVVDARDGEEAVRRAREEEPEAILMDIAMPGMDGICALEALREDTATAEIPVAAITALATGPDRTRIEEAGFDACLFKPFRIPELIGILGELLPEDAAPPAAS